MGARSRHFLELAVLLALGSGSPGQAEAQAEEVEPIRAELTAPQGCPETGEFLRQVLRRTRRARAARPKEPARTFTIGVEPGSSSLVGKLRVMTANREWAERRVEAQTCSEVIEALALVAALIVDPEAMAQPLPSEPVSEQPPEPTQAEPRDEPTAPLAREQRQPPVVAVVPPPDQAPGRAPPRPHERWTLGWRAGLQGEVLAGVAKELMPAARVWSELGWRSRNPWLRPTLGLGVAFGLARIHGKQSSAPIDWIASRLSLCPVGLGVSKVSLSPCALGDVGVIVSPQKTNTSLWAALGGSLRLEVAIVPWLLARLEGGLFSQTETEFQFQSGATTYTAFVSKPVGGFVGLGAGISR